MHCFMHSSTEWWCSLHWARWGCQWPVIGFGSDKLRQYPGVALESRFLHRCVVDAPSCVFTLRVSIVSIVKVVNQVVSMEPA